MATKKTVNENVPVTPNDAEPGLSERKHRISLQTAKTYVKYYKKYKSAILATGTTSDETLPNCETFNATAVRELLNQVGCDGFRIYFGMDTTKKVRLVLVGVDKYGKDITYSATSAKSITAMASSMAAPGEAIFLEDGQRCPHSCPPPSEITGG